MWAKSSINSQNRIIEQKVAEFDVWADKAFKNTFVAALK
jgi:hypothetical protein